LEAKLLDLREKTGDLEAQLQQERRTLSRLKRILSETERENEESKSQLKHLELMLNKHGQRNYILEEREVDLKHHLEMLVKCLPALFVWNLWRIVQDRGISRPDVTTVVSNTLIRVSDEDHRDSKQRGRQNTSPDLSAGAFPPSAAAEQSSKLRDTEQDRKIILIERREAEKTWKAREQPWSKFQVLGVQEGPIKAEIQSYKESEDKHKKRITEAENEFWESHVLGLNKALDPILNMKTEAELNQLSKVPSTGCKEVECMKKLQELEQCEADMKKRINELEMKERAYMETLQKADELWSEMENSYKKRISNAEDNETALRGTVRKLETKLRQVFQHDEENEMLLEKLQNIEKNAEIFMERIRVLEAERNQLIEETTQLRDTLQSVQTELEKTKEMVAGPLKEELLKERKLSRTLQEEITKLERDLRDTSSVYQAQVSPHCNHVLFVNEFPVGTFLFTTTPRPAMGPTQPPNQWVHLRDDSTSSYLRVTFLGRYCHGCLIGKSENIRGYIRKFPH
jgi:hypothetical protein